MLGEYIICFKAFFTNETMSVGNVTLCIYDPDSLSAVELYRYFEQTLIDKINSQNEVKLRSKIPVLITMMHRHK